MSWVFDRPCAGCSTARPCAGRRRCCAGLDRPCAGFEVRDAQLTQLSMAGQEGVLDFPLAAARQLPPTVLVSTCTDLVVPWWVATAWQLAAR
jgi:hypothetical protein